MKKYLTTNNVLWVIYLSLLAVLLPHTAWAFSQFEPAGSGEAVPYLAALAFEAAIAALTHKLAKHIEATKRGLSWQRKFQYQYLNVYSFGLISCLIISSLANLAHAVQFGAEMKIFTDWGVPFGLYAVAFGAVLPCISYVFANVLSNAVEEDSTEDPALTELRDKFATQNKQLRESERLRALAEARFDAMGDVFVKLASQDKRERIIAVRQKWPGLSGNAIALITDSSGAYVSEVLNDLQVVGTNGN